MTFFYYLLKVVATLLTFFIPNKKIRKNTYNRLFDRLESLIIIPFIFPTELKTRLKILSLLSRTYKYNGINGYPLPNIQDNVFAINGGGG
ncbi:hypothetical protein CQA53_00630 [Helicobacter didelphidarum]|uniref:Uncharacterized protein n=1 Tax=Helicobacter didelphidarum TaxID=2040648 RepID=A0A3D8IRJ9_9HELI|nr:hypothetical protein [Helicobacter didelphidarum]RDU67556.1 hypothetical protein CQA53_00630 [Helicobacter didelphidarum]